MPRRDIEFKNGVGITLRGWLYTPDGVSPSEELPCLVMVHGFGAVKEMTLPTIADHFVSNLKLAVLVYDNRGYGASDAGEGQPRNEAIPYDQVSDFSDAITYAQSLSEVDSTRIGIWGSSFSGGHAITVAAGDRRVKAVISQVPFMHGWETVRRLIRADFMGGLEAAFEADRQARAAGQPGIMIPLIDPNPLAQSAIPLPDGHAFYDTWLKDLPHLENKVTARSMEVMRTYIPANVIDRERYSDPYRLYIEGIRQCTGTQKNITCGEETLKRL
ncbi:putative Uncharacterized 31.7 kDa protein in traX-finO intergenic region [Glarea lozoyensis 74030]|uniref:Putative Uncharacterized 31.7 kDa protein in traX-finO intergenic region n=1 Tax=Glarea lozoyensis (strain ATCC 74030 / MF5533) TaxID=1104152 RepID=H0EV58_GLAL7|nr:putative Uncharacterized 31.7 kDa protein in traX-finO intergenic region [Glarea lozoyensis 74030]